MKLEEITADEIVTEDDAGRLIKAANRCRDMVTALKDQETIKGFIVYEEIPVKEELAPSTHNPEDGPNTEEIFRGKRIKEFICFQLSQYSETPALEFDQYDQCVDLYFTQIDS
jgi:hypothetical protein